MGQYYGDKKIGTCESMYYMRLEEAQDLAKREMKDDDGIKFEEYINDNNTKWRFPFPDEDDKAKNQYRNYEEFDRGFKLPVGDLEVSHAGIVLHNTHKSGGHGVNIFLPCPYSEEFKKLEGVKTSNGGAGEQYIDIRFQALRNGQEKTIFACSRCEQLQWFDDANDEIKSIKERATKHYALYEKSDEGLHKIAMETIKRIK